MLQSVIRQRAGVGQELAGELFSGEKIIPSEAVPHQPAEGNRADIRAGAQALERSTRRRRSKRVGRLELEDSQIQLIKLIGRFQPAGLFKLGGGFGGSLEAKASSAETAW